MRTPLINLFGAKCVGIRRFVDAGWYLCGHEADPSSDSADYAPKTPPGRAFFCIWALAGAGVLTVFFSSPSSFSPSPGIY